MCIAIAKKRGIDVPSEQTLKNCFENNNQGAGFAFAYQGKVIIRKGYMTFNDFITAFNEYNERYDFKKLGLLIHFRIATHGGKTPMMTHPFPIVADEGALQKIEYVSDYAIVHNGIITLTRDKADKVKGMSDTALFVKDYLTLIAKNKNWNKEPANMELIYKLIDSKMAVLDKNGDITTTQGFTEDKGVLYSNSTYKDNYYSKYYDWYDDYYTRDYSYGKYSSKSYSKSSSKKDKSKDTKNEIIADLVELMPIEKGSTIESYGSSIDVNETYGLKYYMDADKNIYFTNDEDDDEYAIQDFDTIYYLFADNGKVYDYNARKVEFKPSLFVYPDQIAEY